MTIRPLRNSQDRIRSQTIKKTFFKYSTAVS